MTNYRFHPSPYNLIPQKVHDLIDSDNFRVNHDEDCDLRMRENPLEWNCNCFLSEILEIVGKK